MSTGEKYDNHVPLPGPEDQLAWQAFTRDNDVTSFEWLYLHFIHTLPDYSYKICRERTLAKDTVQNVFTYLLLHRQQLPLPQSVKFYLLRCVRNELLKLLRKHQSIKRVYLKGATFTKNEDEYYPIPQTEIQNSYVNGQATLQQNPGYK